MSQQTQSHEFLAQYGALTHSVGFAPLPERTIVTVSGADRFQFLQSFTTNDVKKLVVGQGCEAFVTSPQGKILGYVLIFCEADHHTIDTTPGQAATLISHFERYVITEDVQFIDRTAESCELLVAGPKATEILTALTSASPPQALLMHAPATIAGRSVVLRRVEYAGSLSYFVQTATVDTTPIAAALVSAGASLCDRAAIDSARLELGVPLFGLDISPDNLPQEVARDMQAISFTKGCYLGQETVARIDAIGHVNRLLVGLKFSADQLPASGTTLLAADQPVGHTTSSAWSPRLSAALALAYVRRNHAKKGESLTSAFGTAEVVSLPLAAS